MSSPPILSISIPNWTATSWNAQTVAGLISFIPHKSTFNEAFFSLPLLIGWWVRNHQTWGLPLLFCVAIILFCLWRLTAHFLGARKPSVFFSALIVLQCAALSWGWTFYTPRPYLITGIPVVDLTVERGSILSPAQKIHWYQQNGYNGFTADDPTKAIFQQYQLAGNIAFSDFFLIDPSLATYYAEQLPSKQGWWVFQKNNSELSETNLREAWKAGQIAAVSVENSSPTHWDLMPLSSQINVILSISALLLFAIFYGMQPASAPLSAPGRVADFLQKRRRLKRWIGLIMMLLAFVGTLVALWLTFYPAWGFVRRETLPLSTTLILCVALDYCYWQGRKTWKKVH